MKAITVSLQPNTGKHIDSGVCARTGGPKEDSAWTTGPSGQAARKGGPADPLRLAVNVGQTGQGVLVPRPQQHEKAVPVQRRQPVHSGPAAALCAVLPRHVIFRRHPRTRGTRRAPDTNEHLSAESC